MEFWSKSNQESGTIEQGSEKVYLKVYLKSYLQGGTSDYSELQYSEKPVPQVSEIQGLLQNKKTSCYEKQNVQEIKKWAVQDLSQNAENPVFSRVEGGSADGRWLQLWRSCDKIELILSIIDSMTPEEKERLFDRLESVER